MGTPDFATPVLERLAREYLVAGVVTQPDRPAGRGKALTSPPVKRKALKLGIPMIQPTRLREPEAFQRVESWEPDIIVVVAFGQILRQNVLDLPKFGCINVHASLLPRWRGAAPIPAAILHGDLITGVTIMKMDKGVDTGDILAQRSTAIFAEDHAEALTNRLSELGAELLIETLPGYLDRSILPVAQDNSLATYAAMLKKEDGELDFHRPAEHLVRQVRAFTPWPGAFFRWEDTVIKVKSARIEPGFRLSAGEHEISNGLPIIGTSTGGLVLEVIQPAGKKPMSGRDYLRGIRHWKKK